MSAEKTSSVSVELKYQYQISVRAKMHLANQSLWLYGKLQNYLFTGIFRQHVDAFRDFYSSEVVLRDIFYETKGERQLTKDRTNAITYARAQLQTCRSVSVSLSPALLGFHGRLLSCIRDYYFVCYKCQISIFTVYVIFKGSNIVYCSV